MKMRQLRQLRYLGRNFVHEFEELFAPWKMSFLSFKCLKTGIQINLKIGLLAQLFGKIGVLFQRDIQLDFFIWGVLQAIWVC